MIDQVKLPLCLETVTGREQMEAKDNVALLNLLTINTPVIWLVFYMTAFNDVILWKVSNTFWANFLIFPYNLTDTLQTIDKENFHQYSLNVYKYYV